MAFETVETWGPLGGLGFARIVGRAVGQKQGECGDLEDEVEVIVLFGPGQEKVQDEQICITFKLIV